MAIEDGMDLRSEVLRSKLGDTLSQKGRGGDTTIGHLTPGEVIIPAEVMSAVPGLSQMVSQAFQAAGTDIGQYTVGGPDDSMNPETGMPEYAYDPEADAMSSGYHGGIQSSETEGYGGNTYQSNYDFADGSDWGSVSSPNQMTAPGAAAAASNITVENLPSNEERAAQEYTRDLLIRDIRDSAAAGGSAAQMLASSEMGGPPGVMSGGRYNRAGFDLTTGANWGGDRDTYNQKEPIPFRQAVSEDFMRVFDHLPGLIPGVNIQDMNYSNRTDDTGQQLAAPPTTDPWSFSQALADTVGYGTGLPVGSAFEFARNQQEGNPLDYNNLYPQNQVEPVPAPERNLTDWQQKAVADYAELQRLGQERRAKNPGGIESLAVNTLSGIFPSNNSRPNHLLSPNEWRYGPDGSPGGNMNDQREREEEAARLLLLKKLLEKQRLASLA